MSLVVLKFGGTSVGSPPQLRRAAAIVQRARARGRVVVVVSALAGVTDLLERAATATAAGEAVGVRLVRTLRIRHLRLLGAVANRAAAASARAALDAVLDELPAALAALATTSPYARAAVLAAGERLAVHVVVAALARRGLDAHAVDATAVLVAHGDPLEAVPDLDASRARAGTWWSGAPDIPVVTGFLAGGAGGTVLLGRGGSDLSATVLGAALDAERVEIWTDTPGVLTADPRLEPLARRHAGLDPATASRLARLGVRVLHPRTLEPLAHGAAVVQVRDTTRPLRRGTRIARGEVARRATIVSGASVLRSVPGADGSRPAAMMLRAHGVPVLDAPLEGALYLPASAGSCARDVLGSRASLQPGPREARWLAVVGARGQSPRAARVARALTEAGIVPLLAPAAALPGVPAALVRATDVAAAVRALHAAFVPRERSVVDVAIAGARGGVGRALLARLERGDDPGQPRLRLVAAFDTRGAVLDPRGLAPGAVEAMLAAAAPEPLDRLLARLRTGRDAPLLLVDCTASEELPARHASLLARGIGVVTANKRSLSGPLERWRTLQWLARRTPLRASATVGAGLPVLSTVRALRRRGDTLWTARAVLSGTLSFVLGELHAGVPFSLAVARARARGLAEPHPGADLSGRDVARKLLILLREAGLELEEDAVEVTPLVPHALLAVEDPEAFLATLPTLDAAFARRVADADARHTRLAYVATWDGSHARAALEEVGLDDALARLGPGENLARLRTALHDTVPLVIAGPGAGAAVTAASLHGDLLSAARHRVSRPARPARVRSAAAGLAGPLAAHPAWA